MQQVNTAVAEMDGVTQQNAAMVEEATAASRSLAAEADQLATQLGRFQLGNMERAAAPPANRVHQLQARASGGQRAAGGRRGSAAAAVAVADDWSAF